MNEILKGIHSPNDLKSLSSQQLDQLCDELRNEIAVFTSKNGGHLASNLGVVELTVALLKTFDVPKDTIVWDVGHQCYSYKMLTGRYDKFGTIRTKNGLTGFPDKDESVYDAFTTGHSSTSISSSFGVNIANILQKDNSHTIAVIGDGALTGGLAFEALNNVGRCKRNFIIILNDNEMSISPNVGSLSSHLNHMCAKKGYLNFKGGTDKVLSKIPVVGKYAVKGAKGVKSFARKILLTKTIFENMGIKYYGPYDGHNINELLSILELSKNLKQPVLIHIKTKKGKGYDFAELNPKDFHGVPKFDLSTGDVKSSGTNFSAVFGNTMVSLAEKNSKVCALTAAMGEGTGLKTFANLYPNRFFDVGIAEAHAVTFAAGLATKGMIPVFAVYSTFLQRAYDSIVHDVSLQNLKVIFAIDRAGFVGEDGKTHQGLLDVSMFKNLPNATVFSPTYYDEVENTLSEVVNGDYKVVAIRYPRGGQGFKPSDFEHTTGDFDVYGNDNAEVCIVCYGRIFGETARLVSDFDENIKIIKLNKIIPISKDAVALASKYKKVLFVEEAVGGIAETFGRKLMENNYNGKYEILDIPTPFVEHAPMSEQLSEVGIDTKGIRKWLKGD